MCILRANKIITKFKYNRPPEKRVEKEHHESMSIHTENKLFRSLALLSSSHDYLLPTYEPRTLPGPAAAKPEPLSIGIGVVARDVDWVLELFAVGRSSMWLISILFSRET